MINPPLLLAIFAGKIVRLITQKAKISGGTAVPGLIALTIDKNFVMHLAKKNRVDSIVITGTNGKTTTARMLSSILEQTGEKPIHNRAGSNLLRGMASALIEKVSFSGKIDNQMAIWETDEAVAPVAVSQTSPQILVVNNLFRDQLDRYGEIDKLRKIWGDAIAKLNKEQILVLNSDDPQVAFLGQKAKAKVFYFGIQDQSLGTHKLPRAADAKFCPNCTTPLSYKTVYVYHMGEYNCPKCFIKRPKPDIFTNKITKTSPESAEFKLVTPVGEAEIKLSVGGLYNIYNALGAATAAVACGINLQTIEAGLKEFRAAFGRVEKFEINRKVVTLLLVKNPAGFNEVIKTLFSDNTKKDVLIAINDLIADGKDVSWLWDVDFDQMAGKISRLFISGIRAQDMALRLKYAQVKNFLSIDNNLENAVQRAIKNSSKRLFILPTYTAMLEVRKILNRMGHGVKFWED